MGSSAALAEVEKLGLGRYSDKGSPTSGSRWGQLPQGFVDTLNKYSVSCLVSLWLEKLTELPGR